jgi:hypothetical protein
LGKAKSFEENQMKHTYRFGAVALGLAVLAVTLSFLVPGSGMYEVASSFLHPAALDVMHQAAPHMAYGLVALRADLDGLVKRAAEKIAEIKDDTPADQARKLEEEHKKILADIEAKRAEIATLETEERQRNEPNPENGRPVTNAERARSADILDIGTRSGMNADDIQAAIRNGEALDAFRARAFEHMVAARASNHTDPARIIQDERETTRNAQIEAMSYRLGVAIPADGPSAAARSIMGTNLDRGRGLIRLAMETTGERNYPESARAREELFERAAHTTSDFPIIMEGSINRSLEARYMLAQPTYRRIARQRNFRDFRPHTVINLGDFPMLKKIAESGEIKFDTLTEGKETISVLSYAVGIALTRQLMINDDLGALDEALADYGQTVALFEEVTFYSQALNGNLNDGNAVFHASHNNLAGTAAAITVDSVALGRAAMGKQKSLSGNPMMVNDPSLVLTGPDKITEAEKLVASITPATVANVNIFSGRLSPFSSSQVSGNAWYLFADPAVGSNYRWGYLDGYEAPRVRIENPFGRQGMAMTVEHDFGCGAVDYRYGYKNAGA